MSETVYSLEACNVDITLRLIRGGSFRQFFTYPDHVVVADSTVDDTRIVTISIKIPKDCSTVNISTSGKTDQDTVVQNHQIIQDQTLEIIAVWVNGVRIESWALEKLSCYLPDYSPSQQQWARDNNRELPPVTNELCFYANGVWSWQISQPFFQHYNKLLLDHLGYINEWVREWHLGVASDSDINRMQELLKDIDYV